MRPSGSSGSGSRRASQDVQQLVGSYQQRLREVEAEACAARAQLAQATQQLEQQRQQNASLQQQLSAAQQQLVHVQQLLLELPRQLVSGTAASSSGQQQPQPQQHVEQVHMAVRSSIQGLQELLELQSKLQSAQLQADTGALAAHC